MQRGNYLLQFQDNNNKKTLTKDEIKNSSKKRKLQLQ